MRYAFKVIVEVNFKGRDDLDRNDIKYAIRNELDAVGESLLEEWFFTEAGDDLQPSGVAVNLQE